MINILYGDESYKINQKISELSMGKQQVEFDLSKDQVADIHKEIATVDLFSEPKVYIIYNLDLFEIKKSKLTKPELELFEKIFNLNLDIIVIANKKLNEKTKFYENYFSQIKYLEYMKENINLTQELNSYIENQKIKISNDAKMHLLSFHEELYSLINDIDKMWQYCDKTLIDLNVVNEVGINYITYKVFTLYEYIFKANRKKAKDYYDTLKNQSIDDAQIFLIYLTQLNKYYQVKVAKNMFGNNNTVAKQLNINPYQVQMITKNTDFIEANNLKERIKLASELDYLYKSGKIDATNAMKIILNQDVI